MSGPVLLVIRLLLAGLLYAFLGWTLWFIWRDLRQQSRLLAAPRILPLVLQRRDGDGVFQFNTAEVIIGRDPVCDWALDDKTISARHARLAYHHGQWWLEDLRSRNGTFLNTKAVLEPLVLATGDEVKFGSLSFIVVLDESRAMGLKSGL